MDAAAEACPSWAPGVFERLGRPVAPLRRLSGGANKEVWAVEDGGTPIAIRRTGSKSVHDDDLSPAQEFALLRVLEAAGSLIPKPIAYLGDIMGRETSVVGLIQGEAMAQRIVRAPPPRLLHDMAEQLALLHAVDPSRVPFLSARDEVDRLEREFEPEEEPHPVIDLAMWWLRENRPPLLPRVICHGDYRVGNVVADSAGLTGILDWEAAHLGDPREDLAWGAIRHWRFGRHDRTYGGIGTLGDFLAAYLENSGLPIAVEDLKWWEVLGNAKWAVLHMLQSRRHLTGGEQRLDLLILGRLVSRVEYELLRLIEEAS